MSSKRIQIVPPKRFSPLKLQDNYGIKVGGIYHINAYSEEADALKTQFLKDGVKYLRSIGYALAEKGFTEMRVWFDRSGIAISGSVYAEYWPLRQDRWLYVWLESSVLRFVGGRTDGLILTARTREVRNERLVEGAANQDFAPNEDSAALAQELLSVFAPMLQGEVV